MATDSPNTAKVSPECGVTSSVMSPARIVAMIFAAACLIGGGGVLYLDIGNNPMDYYSLSGGFDYEYAITFALIGAAYFGPYLFFVSLMLYGFAYTLFMGVKLLLHRK
jgi:hypothetical protein